MTTGPFLCVGDGELSMQADPKFSSLATSELKENTPDAGVTVGGFLLKDGARPLERTLGADINATGGTFDLLVADGTVRRIITIGTATTNFVLSTTGAVRGDVMHVYCAGWPAYAGTLSNGGPAGGALAAFSSSSFSLGAVRAVFNGADWVLFGCDVR